MKLIVEGVRAQLCMLHIIIIVGNTLSRKIFIKLRGQSLNTDDPFPTAKVSPHQNTHISWLNCIRYSQL